MSWVDGTYSSATIRCASAKKLLRGVISKNDWVTVKAQCFSCGEFYSLRRIIIHRETGWIFQQQGNDLLHPEVLNNSIKFGQERKIRTVSVESVFHDVFAVCLYVDNVWVRGWGKCRTRSALYSDFRYPSRYFVYSAGGSSI